jgi:Xaa-Pro aminopeptidase
VPQAHRLADADVAWGGQSTMRTAAEELGRRGAGDARIGIVGALPFSPYQVLCDACREVVNMSRAYTGLRMIKSAEELDWFRLGAWFGDRSIQALLDGLEAGLTERDLGAIVEGAYVPFGAVTGIHFFGVTAMSDPALCVPAQFPSTRRVATGDIVFTEISAAFWEYSGQVLRSFAVDDDPPALFRDLHDAADAAFDAVCGAMRDGATPADIVAAASVIEDAGFTTCDDLVHGYGGGYLPPVIGSSSRPAGPLPDMTLKAGMMAVVQPNVITPDGKAGVQTGGLVLITADGVEQMHHAPRGFLRVGR